MLFEEITEKDFDFIAETYNYYILNSTCIYFTTPLSINDIKAFVPFSDPTYKAFVAKINNECIGFCYFNRFQKRQAFNISVEIAIYIVPTHTRKGYGQKMLYFLEEIIQEKNFQNIVATVNSTNHESITLFERNNYKCVGKFNNIAEKFGEKLSLFLYQKEL